MRITRFALHIAFLCHTYEREMTILSDKDILVRLLAGVHFPLISMHVHAVDKTQKNLLKRDLLMQYDHSNTLIYTAICNTTYRV